MCPINRAGGGSIAEIYSCRHDLIEVHAITQCRQSQEASCETDEASGNPLTVGDCWKELQHSAFGKEMQCLCMWQAIINNQSSLRAVFHQFVCSKMDS